MQANAIIAADASCSALAAVDPSATSGSGWGKTILPGHNKPGGWFGVDVCANGFNAATRGAGANVSCSAMPSNWNATGCAPGHPTRDGYGLSFQCVELIVRFSAWAFGERGGWFGNAPDLWLNGNHPADFQALPNGSSRPPVPGDILVWGYVDGAGQPWPAGPNDLHDGHVAVVAAVRDGQVITAEENVLWGGQDHPTDTLSLNHTGNQWIVGGTAAPATTLPTFRWPATMGHARATYGWLHSTHNTGKFPSSGGAQPSAPSPTPTAKPIPTTPPTPTVTPTPPPTLPDVDVRGVASGAVVTASGALADVVAAPTSPSAGSDAKSGSSPRQSPQPAQARGLGAPAGIWLAPDQQPAVLMLSDGQRVAYVRGQNGKLYAATTGPDLPGVRWQTLGSPDGIVLLGSVSATTFAGGVAVAALGSDGNVWWRGGPFGQLGGWLSLGRPDGVMLRSTPVLAGLPGTGNVVALALGWDGHLYTLDIRDASSQPDPSTQPAAGQTWTTVALPRPDTSLTGNVLAVTELATGQQRTVGTWLDTPLDIFVLDGTQRLWWLRRVGDTSSWAAQAIPAPQTTQALLAGVAVRAENASGPARAAALDLYMADARGLVRVTLTAPSSAAAASGTATNADAPTSQPDWQVIGPVPAFTVTSLTALRLGQDVSGLLMADGQRLELAGSPTSAALLGLPAGGSATEANSPGEQSTATAAPASAPATATPSTTPGAAATAPAAGTSWVTIGAVPALAMFDDPLLAPQLDPRWARIGPSEAAVRSVEGGVALAPVVLPGRTLLLQAATVNDVAMDVRVTVPSGAASAAQAGLVFYFDDADLLTLGVDTSGHVSFCPVAQGKPTPCQTTSVDANASSGVLLRLSHLGDTYAGYASLDGLNWTQVGVWQPAIASGATSASAANGAVQTALDAAATLPSMGLFAATTAQGAPELDTTLWPHLAGFSISSGVLPSN